MRLFLGNFIIKHLVTLVVSLAYHKGKVVVEQLALRNYSKASSF